MRWAGLLCACAVMCSLAGLLAPQAQAADEKSAVAQAEGELKGVAHSDPERSDVPDVLSVDPDLAIWTVVVFVILLIVLKKFAWGPIMAALEGREHNIAEHIAQAERNHEEAKRLLAQYEKRLAAAADEVRGMMEEARKDAEHAKQGILTEAKAGAEAERNRALRDIESATDAAMESLAQRSAQLAVELAGKILQSKLSADDHARLIKEAMAKFPASNASSN